MSENSLGQKVTALLNSIRYYWKKPAKGRYMSYKEIASYAFGGIGFYLIVQMSYTCLLAATNVFITGTIGISPTDMYILYVIGVLSSIPLTGIRANIIDNTRNKAGKYRPYILTMGIPTALLFVGMVWFPYDKLGLIVGTSEILGKSAEYIAKCAVILLFNILLQFFYYFFYDAYENLIHVLSPNSQERADVAAIKSVVYSFGPTVVNLIMPIIAQALNTNQTDIRVYRLVFPILAVLGVGLCVIVYANTQEKIIQAKTHVIQIKFIDALKAVAKNKYFWIISFAGWIGFLETAYNNILYWLYNYGGACDGNVYGIIVTVYGNASLWGMLLAPFCIRKWGKKNVQIVTNLLNIVFIIAMILFTGSITKYTIWLMLICLYFNAVVSAFAHILNPSIQADIRDYQQYKTGERIDGMFAAVSTIGSVITLISAGVIPALQERFGLNAATAEQVVNNQSIMSRLLPVGKTVGQLLQEQAANGQDIFNPSNALYDVDGVLLPLLRILIIVAAAGATLNVIPFFFYDLTEKKQKSVVRVLKVRAMFEDYANDALSDKELVEAIDLVNNAREMAAQEPKSVSKADYQNAKTKEEWKAAKKAYREALEFNEEIEISQFVCSEFDKFSSENVIRQVSLYKKVYDDGLNGIKNMDVSAVKAELAAAKKLPKGTVKEKEMRKFEIELAKKKLSSHRSYEKYFGSLKEFAEPDIDNIKKLFDIEDECDEKISELAKELAAAKSSKDIQEMQRIKAEIKAQEQKRAEARKSSKKEMDEYASFNRAAEVYISARKLLQQQENFSRFDEIAAKYDEAKSRAEEAERLRELEEQEKLAQEKAELEARKQEKALKKEQKKNKSKEKDVINK